MLNNWKWYNRLIREDLVLFGKEIGKRFKLL